MFTGLPDRLTRPVVRGACLRAADAPADAARAFLTHRHGLGIWASRIRPLPRPALLDGTAAADSQLQAAAGMLSEGGPVAAYALLGDNGAPRLARLGPAFGTKFLYFCSPAASKPALILDRLVAACLRENADLSLNEARWSVWTYERYLQTMFGWAGELDIAADEPEACIFSEQAGLVSSQWATNDQPFGQGPQTKAL